jgi:hypothetical protein
MTMTTERVCGTCNACCKAVGVADLTPPKPPHVWCPHALRPGKGCGIYAQRPTSCRVFSCAWLVGMFPEESMRPDRCHVVITLTEHTEAEQAVFRKLGATHVQFGMSFHELRPGAGAALLLRLNRAKIYARFVVFLFAPDGQAEGRYGYETRGQWTEARFAVTPEDAAEWVRRVDVEGPRIVLSESTAP